MHGFVDRFAQGVFTPETVKMLTGAFDEAWRQLESSNAPWAQPDYADSARTIIAKHMIAEAKAGEKDRRSLIEGALLHLSKQTLRRSPQANNG